MSYIIPGDDMVETFGFPNGMQIKVDYGIIWEGKYEPYFERYSGSLRRSQVLDSNKSIITEIIEKNPDELPSGVEFEMLKEGKLPGDEFERIINFPNGYTAKIEYWVTPEKHDENYGRYNAEYQKRILLDENNNIISEIMDYNPHYKDPNAEVIYITDPDFE